MRHAWKSGRIIYLWNASTNETTLSGLESAYCILQASLFESLFFYFICAFFVILGNVQGPGIAEIKRPAFCNSVAMVVSFSISDFLVNLYYVGRLSFRQGSTVSDSIPFCTGVMVVFSWMALGVGMEIVEWTQNAIQQSNYDHSTSFVHS